MMPDSRDMRLRRNDPRLFFPMARLPACPIARPSLKSAIILAGVLVSSLTTQTSAQTHPDFSGRWTSEPDTEATSAAAPARGGGGGRAPRGDMGSGWASNITIAQDVQKLSVEYAFFVRGDMQPPLKFVYALDGSESKNTVMMGRGIQEQK